MNALVTGSTGFIGSHLVDALLARGDRVFCLVRPRSRTAGLEGRSPVLVRADYRDPGSLQAAVRGMDAVFHLAGAITAPDEAAYEAANTAPTRALLRACAESAPNLGRFVFVSSISAAGPSPRGEILSEEAPCHPISGYGRSKLRAEEAVREFAALIPAVIVRPTNVLGARQRELASSIALVARRILPLVGNGEPQTSLIAVEDVCRALLLAAEKPAAVGRTYFLTDGRAYAWRDITAAIAFELGIRRFLFRVPYRIQRTIAGFVEAAARLRGTAPALTREGVDSARNDYWLYDGGRIRRELGFEPQLDMVAAVRRTIAWAEANGKVRMRR